MNYTPRKMIDDGYIKFKCRWTEEKLQPKADLGSLNIWRDKIRKNNWIGQHDDGIGFGNLSQRIHDNIFIISGSATGGYENLHDDDYAMVTNFNIADNTVDCKGMTKASSETLSHAIIYKTLPDINFAFHIHDLDLWSRWINKLPTTDKSIEYGTPEMAYEIKKIILKADQYSGIFIMGGHKEGIISYGKSPEDAWNHLLQLK